MEEKASKETPKARWVTILAGGCLAILYVYLCIFATIAGFIHKERFPNLNHYSSTPTVSNRSTPEILVHPPDKKNMIRFEDFSSNIRDWSLYYPNGKVEVINGKLVLQSSISGNSIIGENENFISRGETYYVQADFTTDINTFQQYGLVFGMNSRLNAYYLFSVAPAARGYQLFKYNSGEWNELIPFSSTDLLRYPDTNTLSVYFDKGNIEIYIDGNLMSSYMDKQPLQFTGMGAFVGNSGYRLIVDNFFAYTEK